MTANPSLVISIDRASLGLAPFVLTGTADPDADMWLRSYTEPPLQPRITYAPTSEYMHGDVALGWTFQQALLAFTAYAPRTVTTEAASRALTAELVAAATQFDYTATVTVSDAPAESWTCQPGAVVQADQGRGYRDLRRNNPDWAVQIPVYPIRSVAS